MKFKVGSRVNFKHGKKPTGTVVGVNGRTVVVRWDNGQEWGYLPRDLFLIYAPNGIDRVLDSLE